MTYEETIKKASKKLVGWSKTSSLYGIYYKSLTTTSVLHIRYRGFGRFANADTTVTIFPDEQSPIVRLQDIFTDPFNISKEEAELFKLEHGFDYPKELINNETN